MKHSKQTDKNAENIEAVVLFLHLLIYCLQQREENNIAHGLSQEFTKHVDEAN